MRTIFLVLLFAAAAPLLAAAHAGAAGDDAEGEADRHFRDGKEFFEKGQLERASYHFDKAYELSANWQYLELAAKCWLARESYENAEFTLSLLLKKGGAELTPEQKEWALGELERIDAIQEGEAARAEARAAHDRARALFARGEYEKAAIALEQANELSPEWEFLETIGRTEAALGNDARALTAFERYLAEGGTKVTAERRVEVERAIAEARARLAGRDGAADTARAGTGETAPPEPAGASSEIEAVGAEPAPDRPPFDWDPRKRVWTWIVGGVGVAALLAAIVTGAVAADEQRKIDETCPDRECPEEYLAGALARQETVGDLRQATDGLLIGGAVAVGAGIALFFIEPRLAGRTGPASAIALAPAVDGDGAGAVVRGEF